MSVLGEFINEKEHTSRSACPDTICERVDILIRRRATLTSIHFLIEAVVDFSAIHFECFDLWMPLPPLELWLVEGHVVVLLTSQHADLASAEWSTVIDHECTGSLGRRRRVKLVKEWCRCIDDNCRGTENICIKIRFGRSGYNQRLRVLFGAARYRSNCSRLTTASQKAMDLIDSNPKSLSRANRMGRRSLG